MAVVTSAVRLRLRSVERAGGGGRGRERAASEGEERGVSGRLRGALRRAGVAVEAGAGTRATTTRPCSYWQEEEGDRSRGGGLA